MSGREEGAPPLPADGDQKGEEALKKTLRKFAKQLAQTQTPSHVP